MFDKDQGKKGWVCPKCKLARGANLHDPCIADLPGVVFACCGHGKYDGYIMFANRTYIRFITTLVEMADGQKIDVNSPEEVRKYKILERVKRKKP